MRTTDRRTATKSLNSVDFRESFDLSVSPNPSSVRNSSIVGETPVRRIGPIRGLARRLFDVRRNDDDSDNDKLSRASSYVNIVTPDTTNNATFFNLLKHYPSQRVKCRAHEIDTLLNKFNKSKNLRAIKPIVSNEDLIQIQKKCESLKIGVTTRSHKSEICNGISYLGRESQAIQKIAAINDQVVIEVIEDFHFRIVDKLKVHKNDERVDKHDDQSMNKLTRRLPRTTFISPEPNPDFTMSDLQRHVNEDFFYFRSNYPQISFRRGL